MLKILQARLQQYVNRELPDVQAGFRKGRGSDQIRSVAQSCPTLCDPMNRSTPGLPVHHQLPEFTETHVHQGRGTRDQIANICWIMEKAREFQKNIYFCFIDYAKAFDCVDHNKLENSERDGNTIPPDLPLEKFVCRSGSNS